MRLKAYLIGERMRMNSPLAPDVAVASINDAAGHRFDPFASGVVGRAKSGHVSLRYRSSPFEYNAKPVLVGTIEGTEGGCILALRYRAPAWVYPFEVFWYAFLILSVTLLAMDGWPPGTQAGDRLSMVAILAALFAAPVLLHAIGTRNSDRDLSSLLAFLARSTHASRISSPPAKPPT